MVFHDCSGALENPDASKSDSVSVASTTVMFVSVPILRIGLDIRITKNEKTDATQDESNGCSVILPEFCVVRRSTKERKSMNVR